MILAAKGLTAVRMAKLRFYSVLFCLSLVLGSCVKTEDKQVEISGSALGTTFSIKLASIPPNIEVSSLQTELENLLTRIDSSMSVFYPTSEVARFNRSETNDWFKISPELSKVISESLRISEETNGAFDFSIGSLIELWGFGKSPGSDKIPGENEIEKAFQSSGHHQFYISTDQSSIRKSNAKLSINLSASAKGYTVDRVARLLEKHEIFDYLVEIGGEIRTRGKKKGGNPWLVAIERPEFNNRSIQRILKLGDNSMATSGDYRNFFEVGNRRFSHTIDPQTGWPVDNEIASVSVIHPSCMTADALATALNVMGFERGFRFAKEHNYRVFWIIRNNGNLVEKHSPGFKSFLE